jgi:hypothetical protein
VPLDAAWARQHKVPLIAGGAGLVALLAWRSRHSSSTAATSSTGAASSLYGVPTVNGVPTVSGMSGYDSSQLDQYNQLAGAISSANDAIGSLSTQVSSLAAGSTVQPATTGLPNPAASSPATGANPTSIYTKIPTEQAGSFDAASGDTIYAQVNGQYVPVAQGNKRLPNFQLIPAGSSLYIKNP